MIPAAVVPTSSLWTVSASSSSDPRLYKIRQQFLFCVIATFVDGVGTFLHLIRGASELNPVWIKMIDQVGLAAAMGLRIAIGVFLLSILFAFWRGPLAQLGLKIMVFAFVPLTLWHIFLLIYLPTIS